VKLVNFYITFSPDTLVYYKVGNRFPVSRVAVNLRHKLPTLLPKTCTVTFTSTCLVNSCRQFLRHYLYCVTCLVISNRCRCDTLDVTARHTSFVVVFYSYWVYNFTASTIFSHSILFYLTRNCHIYYPKVFVFILYLAKY